MELVAGAHRLDERVLHEVFGLGRVARQLARDAVHGVQVGERLVGERIGFLRTVEGSIGRSVTQDVPLGHNTRRRGYSLL